MCDSKLKQDGHFLPYWHCRDWVHVEDHNDGVWKIIQAGNNGSTYNIGGGNERTNIDLVQTLCKVFSDFRGIDQKDILGLITYVSDRPGHDKRYAIDSTKIQTELGWDHKISFEKGLEETVRWYLENTTWVESIRSGKYRDWIEKNYKDR